MARTALTATSITTAGVDPTGVDAAANVDGHSFTDTGRTFLYVLNGSGSPITVSSVVGVSIDSLTIPTKDVTVAAGAYKLIGGWSEAYYQSGTASTVYVNFSAVTSVTCALLEA